MRRGNLWSSNYVKLMITTFILSLCFNMFVIYFPLYLQNIGISKSEIGIATSIFTFSALIFRPLFGYLIDIKGRKMVFLIGIILFSIMLALYNYSNLFLIILVLRFIHGISFSSYTTASGTIVADIVPLSDLGKGISYFAAINILASAIGPILISFLVNTIHFKMINLLLFVMTLLAFCLATTIKYKSLVVDSQKTKMFIFIEITAVAISIMAMIILIPAGIIMNFLPLYLNTKGNLNCGVFFTASAAVILLTRPFIGRILDNHHPKIILIPSIFVFSVCFLMLCRLQNVTHLIVSGILYGFGFGTIQPTLNSVLMKLCHVEKRGLGSATFFSAMDLAVSIGAITGGFIIDNYGYNLLFILSFFIVLLSFVYYITYLDKKISYNYKYVK